MYISQLQCDTAEEFEDGVQLSHITNNFVPHTINCIVMFFYVFPSSLIARLAYAVPEV